MSAKDLTLWEDQPEHSEFYYLNNFYKKDQMMHFIPKKEL